MLHLLAHTIDGIVSQVFRRQTPSARKDLDQPAPDFLVLSSSRFSIRVEPREQLVEGFLGKVPAFFMEGPLTRVGYLGTRHQN